MHLVNSTVSTNHSGGAGGGIYNSADLTVTNSTVAYNDAVDGGGGFGIFNAATARLFNTIVAHNFHTTNSYLDDLGGKLLHAKSSHNLIGENLKDVNDLRLGALGYNGGPTWTHELREGSIAIDDGDKNLAKSFDGTDLAEDQTGRSRVVPGGGNGPLRVDVGAFEYVHGN